MFGWLEAILGIGGKTLDKVFPDRAASREQQSKVNEAEVSGAPASRLRLWRSFLGWALALLFVWEVAGRSIIVTYWPDAKLPPSMLKEVMSMLLGMLGLGF
jgi:hypothetical protein